MGLHWNFCGTRNNKIQNTNLFLFRNLPERNAHQFLSEFYAHSSFGDLIGLAVLSEQKSFKSINWIERSGFQFTQEVSEKNIGCTDPFEVISDLLPKFINRSGLNSINFYDPDLEE